MPACRGKVARRSLLGVLSGRLSGTHLASKRAYEGVARISWEGVQFRRDIGYRAIGRAQDVTGNQGSRS